MVPYVILQAVQLDFVLMIFIIVRYYFGTVSFDRFSSDAPCLFRCVFVGLYKTKNNRGKQLKMVS